MKAAGKPVAVVRRSTRTMRFALIAPSFAALVACTSVAPSQPAAAKPPAAAGPLVAMPPAAPSVVSTAAVNLPPRASPPRASPTAPIDLQATLCGERRPCRLIERHDAGRDAQGRPLVVAKLALFDGKPKPDDHALRAPGECDAYEYWSAALDTTAVADVHKLVDVCNDGYGAAEVGEDTVTVGPNTFEHEQSGGSAWRWSNTLALSLSPLRPRMTASRGFWSVDVHFSAERWSWDDFSGKAAWFTPACNASGDWDGVGSGNVAGEDAEVGGDVDAPPAYAFAYLPIPAVALDAAFASGGFRSASLGRCAAAVDSTGARGFVIHGAPGAATDASMKVVAAAGGKKLFVEVRDDVFIRQARTWLFEDHLELWIADANLPDFGAQCVPRGKGRLDQWAITLDGDVIAAKRGTDAKALGVVHATGPDGSERFAIDLPPYTATLALIYSDSDDGKTQKRLLSTSKLRRDVPESLGAFESIPPTSATCRLDGSALAPAVTLGYTPPP